LIPKSMIKAKSMKALNKYTTPQLRMFCLKYTNNMRRCGKTNVKRCFMKRAWKYISKNNGNGKKPSNSFGKKRKTKQKIRGLTKDMYTIKTSTIPNAGNGAFANIFLPKGTVLGHYRGKKLSAKQYDRLEDSSYVWELSSKNGPFYIDGKPEKYSNWLRYLNDSRDKRQNVEPYQSHGKLYYRTIKNVKAGQELFITYGDDYW